MGAILDWLGLLALIAALIIIGLLLLRGRQNGIKIISICLTAIGLTLSVGIGLLRLPGVRMMDASSTSHVQRSSPAHPQSTPSPGPPRGTSTPAAAPSTPSTSTPAPFGASSAALPQDTPSPAPAHNAPSPAPAQGTSSAPHQAHAPSASASSVPSATNNILDMDEVCGYLGLSSNAWLPGQQSATDLTGRIIYAPNAAYTWSCTQDGPKLTQQQITQGCQIWYPGTTAYAQDPNNAYSWTCV
jgi:hypothetical protein